MTGCHNSRLAIAGMSILTAPAMLPAGAAHAANEANSCQRVPCCVRMEKILCNASRLPPQWTGWQLQWPVCRLQWIKSVPPPRGLRAN